MIEHIRGTVDSAGTDSVVIDAGGIGYRVSIASSTAGNLPAAGRDIKLYIVESTAMYGGGTTLYGFLTKEERDVYLLLKDAVPGAGAKKAMEYLDKITKSIPDFKRIVLAKDTDSLTGIFGFTKKTADRLIAALKDRIGEINVAGKEKWAKDSFGSVEAEAVAGLVMLGYRDSQSREAVARVLGAGTQELSAAQIIKSALRNL